MSRDPTANSSHRQRAFRERQKRHIEELETKIGKLQSLADRLQQQNQELQIVIARLQNDAAAYQQIIQNTFSDEGYERTNSF